MVHFASENADKYYVKKTTSDRKWITFILVLLVVEVLWLLVDLNWITLPFIVKKSQQIGSVEAGYIISTKKDLKRRGANSLIWEETRAKDILFYHDSVLTLSQSAARLYLKDQTDLELSENTLVTLEEPEDKTKSEIRLRFSRGDMRARNPSFKTSVVGDEWVVNLDKGSDIVLRKDKDSYEFEVVSGTASLQTENGNENLETNKILKLGNDQKIETFEKNQNLQWKEKKPLRIYTFNQETEVPLAWDGKVNNLLVGKAGESEKIINVNNMEGGDSIKLPHGSYKIRLQNESGLSEVKSVEVWSAPYIYLKKPLPRDRVKTNESFEFVWTTHPGIKSYIIEFNYPDGRVRTENAEQNFKSVQFDNEQDLTWQIKGIDEEGHPMPSLYNNELYLRDEPLQAPKLKAPNVKPETPPGANYRTKYRLWYELIFSKANAKEAGPSYEINFEWESVGGADKYILEVSSTPDFRNPELIKTLNKTSYLWKNVKYKKYYWRVAAGNAKGRMGMFSEPSELKMEEIQISEAVPVVEKPVEKIVSKEVKPVLIPSLRAGWGLAYAPGFKSTKLTGDEQTTMQLQGLVPAAIQISYQSDWINNYNYHVNLRTISQAWKAQPEAEYPLQSELKIMESVLTLDRSALNKNLRWGLMLHHGFIPKRETEGSLKTAPTFFAGFRVSRVFEPNSDWRNLMGLSLVTAGITHEAILELQTKRYLFTTGEKIRWSVGAGLNTSYQTGSGSGSQNEIIFLLGLEQF